MKKKMQSFILDYIASGTPGSVTAVCIDVEHGSFEEMFMSLYEQFVQYCNSERIHNARITKIEEVEYDGPFEPWTGDGYITTTWSKENV